MGLINSDGSSAGNGGNGEGGSVMRRLQTVGGLGPLMGGSAGEGAGSGGASSGGVNGGGGGGGHMGEASCSAPGLSMLHSSTDGAPGEWCSGRFGLRGGGGGGVVVSLSWCGYGGGVWGWCSGQFELAWLWWWCVGVVMVVVCVGGGRGCDDGGGGRVVVMVVVFKRWVSWRSLVAVKCGGDVE